MTDKRSIKRSIKQLQTIKTWQLAILLVLMLFITATFLRMNNTGMIQRRQAVAAADKTGNIDEINARIYDLQRYSAAHMNANTGTFYLTEQYNREVRKRAEAVSEQSSEASLAIRRQADAVCQPQFTTWSPAYVRCFADELAKYPAETITEANLELPSSALYRYSFVSPRWSPDFAGWSVVISLLIVAVIVLRLLSLAILRMLLKRHYREY